MIVTDERIRMIMFPKIYTMSIIIQDHRNNYYAIN